MVSDNSWTGENGASFLFSYYIYSIESPIQADCCQEVWNEERNDKKISIHAFMFPAPFNAT